MDKNQNNNLYLKSNFLLKFIGINDYKIMELRQLKYFIKVADLLSFTEAAYQIPISQSTLSQQILNLEVELDTKLFDRIGKKIYLTQTGKLFYTYAKQTVQIAEDGKKAISNLAQNVQGTLKIGSTYALRNVLLDTVTQFSKNNPKVQFELFFDTTQKLLHDIQDLKYDFILTFLNHDYQNTNLTIDTLLKSGLVLVYNLDKNPCTDVKLSLKQLENLPLVLPHKEYSTRKYVDTILNKNNIKPNILAQVNDIATLFQLVQTGNFYSITSQVTIVNMPNLGFKKIQNIEDIQTASIITLKNMYYTHTLNQFIQMLKSVAKIYNK